MLLNSACGLIQGEYREACMDRWLKDSRPLGDILMTCGERVVIEVIAT